MKPAHQSDVNGKQGCHADMLTSQIQFNQNISMNYELS